MDKRLRTINSFVKLTLGQNVPINVRALVTTRCNMSCIHCKVYKRKSEEMTANQWREAIDKLDELGTVNLTFQGGEPLLKEDLSQILEYSHKRMFTNVTTNGILLPRKIEEISSHIDSLSLSIDSLFNTDYGKTIDKKLLDLILESSKKNGFSVNTVCVISRQNLGEVDGLVKIATDYGFHVRLNPIHSDVDQDKWMFRGYSPESEFRKQDIPKLQNLVSRLVNSPSNITNFDSHLLQLPKYFAGERWICDAGRLYFDINPDGKVMPCQDLPPTNVRIQELKKGKYYQQIMDAGGLKTLKACGGDCVYDCTWQTSYAIKHPLGVLLKFRHLLKK